LTVIWPTEKIFNYLWQLQREVTLNTFCIDKKKKKKNTNHPLLQHWKLHWITGQKDISLYISYKIHFSKHSPEVNFDIPGFEPQINRPRVIYLFICCHRLCLLFLIFHSEAFAFIGLWLWNVYITETNLLEFK
jgi:hypothetical protein